MNVPKKNNLTKANALPKVFGLIFEELSDKKFAGKPESGDALVCQECVNFMKNMERAAGPKDNKLSDFGKKKVQRLMDKKRLPAGAAIEVVLAEQRAKQMLVASGLRKIDSEGNLLTVSNNEPSNKLPSLLDNSVRLPRLSGAQRKKVHILIEGGMDSRAARELVFAASLANKLNPPNLSQNHNGTANERDNSRRRPRNRRSRQDGQGHISEGQQKTVNINNQHRTNSAGKSGMATEAQKVPAPEKKPVVPSKQAAAPVRREPESIKSNSGSVKKVVATNKKIIDSPGILLPQKRQQQSINSSHGRGRSPRSERRGRTRVSPRRNERPAPYNTNNRSQNQNQSSHRQQQIQPLLANDNFNPNRNRNQQQDMQFQNNSCEVGIVPINYPHSILDDQKLDALKDAITNEILKIPEGGPVIRFLGTSAENGWLKIVCADKMSYMWLAELVSRWERVGVRLVEGDNMPMTDMALLSFYLKQDFRTPNEILNIIDKQNPGLNAHQWRLMNRESDGNGQRITVCVSENCYQALKRLNFTVFLGLGVVELHSMSSDHQRNSFSQNLTAMGGNDRSGQFKNFSFNDNQSRGSDGGGYGGNNYNRTMDYKNGNQGGWRVGFKDESVW